MPLVLCNESHDITQQPDYSFPLDSLKKIHHKQNKPIPLGATPIFLHSIFSLNNFGGKKILCFMPNPSTKTVQSFLIVTCKWFSWSSREFSTANEGFLQQCKTRFSLTMVQLCKEVGPWHFLCDSISSCRIEPFLPPFYPPPSFSEHVCWKIKWVPHQSWYFAE